MGLDLKKFENQLPSFVSCVWDVLLPLGFTPTLVGGVVRDFFLKGTIGRDWDIELSHQSFSWDLNSWKDLGRSLGKLGKVSFLPYDIIRLDLQGHQLEFSPPRIETFTEANHHKNFTASFDYRLSFEEAVRRRDFTINAMGIKVMSPNQFEFLDPLQGLLHLREKVLHQAGPDFGRDPVRFLRAIRFMIKFQLTPSGELEQVLKTMPAGGFSASYLWNEMQKSGSPISFYRKLHERARQHPEIKLPLPRELNGELEELPHVLPDPTRHECWMVALEWVGLSSEQWSQYFTLSQESARRLARWAHASRKFKELRPEIFHGEFDDIKDKSEFIELFDWYFTTKQILQKNPDLPLLNMIEEFLPEWIHLYRFEPVKDVKHIDPPLRAKYQVWNLCQRL